MPQQNLILNKNSGDIKTTALLFDTEVSNKKLSAIPQLVSIAMKMAGVIKVNVNVLY